ncbi:ATP-dependent Clp protease proteolytic subunit [uncultured Porphyromonas sp.]|uniref:SDH family Clp fold serine proteinase n=1 Tax=uncultured Porphyromonas sp. TaxID=159274 RepID=UPI0025950873|nr:ATP-dependent Clp protease proteolytic subunit [uncultured Porphyromonas sp.]
MPSWNEILNEIDESVDIASVLNKKRIEYFGKISAITGRNVIAYYSAWLKHPERASIDEQDKNAFMSAVHNLDRSKGLDLVLHTPGGDIAATESIVTYLKSMFKGDIRAIVPQISMSAGTMIALSCKQIIMGEQSSLGPIDPHFGGVPCQGVLDEFRRAVKEVEANPSALGLWQTIVSKYHPTFLGQCENAIEWSKKLMSDWVSEVNTKVDINELEKLFLDHKESYSHSRHISKASCKNVGLNILDLELNQDLQDAVLSLHHCYMILFDKFNVSKIVENQNGNMFIQNIAV